MVKITYTGTRFTRRRLPTGRWITFRPDQTVEIKSNRLAEQLEKNRDFEVKTDFTSKVGGGLKTHVKPAKPRGRPPKSKKGKSKIQQKVDKALKKPKGLKKSKRAD